MPGHFLVIAQVQQMTVTLKSSGLNAHFAQLHEPHHA